MKDRLKKIVSRIWKRKWRFLVGLVVVIVLVIRGIKKFSPSESKEAYVHMDHVVETGNVVESLNLPGTTQFANAQKLTFVNKGKVTSVSTKVGANVKKGDILATLTTDDLDREVEKAKKTLKNRQLDLKKLLEKSDKELDLLKAQSTYDLLLIQKQTLPNEQALDIEAKKAEIEDEKRLITDKENELEEAKNDYAELLSGKAGASHAELALSKNVRERNNLMEKLVRGFREESIALKATLDAYDAVIKLGDTYTADEQNIYIGAKDMSLLNQSKNGFWDIKKYEKQLNDLYNEYSVVSLGKLTENQILSGYTIFKKLGTDLKAWGKINHDMFLESIETDTLTKENINGYAKTFGTDIEMLGYQYNDKYTSAVETLAGLKDSDTTIQDAASKVDRLAIELEKLKISLQKKVLELEVLGRQNTLTSAELDKKIQDAKIELEKARDGNAQKDEIEAIQNDIDNMEFDLETLMKKYDEYRITANFDGIVTKLDMQVGDSIEMGAGSSENQKYIYVETPDLLEVQLEVDQIDIVKIGMGMPVEVYIDAFPDKMYTGSFAEIDTMPNENNSYKAKVVFQKHNPEEKILGGMTANVKVIVQEAKDVVVVPNGAVADSEDGQKIIRLKKGETWIDQVVEIGMSDDMNTEILSGITVGDTIKGLYINETSLQNAGIDANKKAKDMYY